MEILNELKETINKVITIVDKISEESNSELWEKALLIIHQRLCHELVEISKKNIGKKLNTIPEFMDMMTAINILEGCYPELKKES